MNYMTDCDRWRFMDLETICFVGDSITHSGLYLKHLYAYYLLRYPQERFIFRNCGTAGDNLEDVLSRIDYDILCHNPDTVTLMLGMNDIERQLYTSLNPDNEIQLKMQRAIDKYALNMQKIVRYFIDRNIKVILITPSPYDQITQLSGENFNGADDALEKCSELVKKMAGEYGCRLIDFHESMNKINVEMQKMNSSSTIIGEDRVHPGEAGHLVMAYLFLKQQGITGEVAEVKINAKELGLIELRNAEVFNMNYTEEKICFDYRPHGQPTLYDETYKKVDSLVSITNNLNKEILCVKGLKEGNYELIINGMLLDQYSHLEFEDGLNIGMKKIVERDKLITNVYTKLNKKMELEGSLRRINFIEKSMYKMDLNSADKNCFNKFSNQFLKNAEGKPYYEYCKESIKHYNENKPKEHMIINEINYTIDSLNNMNRLITYNVTIRKV